MFTGLIQELGEVADVVDEGVGTRLIIAAPQSAASATVGASIAINGCCLTVVDVGGERLSFQAGPETLSRTNLGELRLGRRVNLEASLRMGDALGGHFVTGHVDAVGTLAERDDDGDWTMMWFDFPPRLAGEMASKGSIAIDGVSLTLVDVESTRFSVCLIPHTLAVTTLGPIAESDRVNLETDLLAKYVARQLATAALNP